MYRQEIRLLSKKEVSDRRRELLKDLNGNAFFFFVEAVVQRNASCILEEAYGRHGNIQVGVILHR